METPCLCLPFVSSKPSDGRSCGAFIGFIADKAGGCLGKGCRAAGRTHPISPRLTAAGALSRLPSGRQARADLSRDKSAKQQTARFHQTASCPNEFSLSCCVQKGRRKEDGKKTERRHQKSPKIRPLTPCSGTPTHTQSIRPLTFPPYPRHV